MRKLIVPLYVNEKTWYAMKNSIGKVSEDLVNIINTGEFLDWRYNRKVFSDTSRCGGSVAYSFIGNNKITTAQISGMLLKSFMII